MKIEKVIVKKLFKIFDHEIKINEQSGITILIGENGLGKTALLEMVEAFFNKKYSYLNEFEFNELIFEFSDQIKWIISKNGNELNINEVNENQKERYSYTIDTNIDEEVLHKVRTIARDIPYLRRRGINKWTDIRNDEELTNNDIINMFYPDIYDKNQPEWFENKINSIKVNLIKTQRLLIFNKNISTGSLIHAVEKYSNEIVEKIKQKLAESTKLSSDLDRTYPNRLLKMIANKNNVKKLDSNLIIDGMRTLEEKRTLLDKVGLIETEKDLDLKINFRNDIVNVVLEQYIKDSFKKLEIFDEISQRIALLIDIINCRFKHKKLYIDKDKGFDFKSNIVKNKDGIEQSIPIDKLSSGEQNELVLFYELIFKTESNSLILIDEPEISLHISWQNNFISDLKKIIAINHLDVLIATHSPDIIGNNWELTIELEGVE